MPTRQRAKDPVTVLLVGNYRPTLAVARALHGAGHRVVLSPNSFRSAGHSRFISEVWQPLEEKANPASALESLEQFSSFYAEESVIFPVNQDAIVRLLPHLDTLNAKVAMTDPDVVRLCVDKGRMDQLATELALPIAPNAVVASEEELIAEAERVGYPCILRWNDGLEHIPKAFIFQDRQELEFNFPYWPYKVETFLLQRYVTGTRFNRNFIAENGKVLQYVDIKTLRTNKADGTGSGTAGLSAAPLREMDEPTERLIAHMNYTGVGIIQFLVDEASGEMSFLELNPRVGANYAFAHYCGLDQANALVNLARGLPLTEGEAGFSYPIDRHYVWFHGDLDGVMNGLRSRRLGLSPAFKWLTDATLSALRADMHLVWSRDDPLPTLLPLPGRVIRLGWRFCLAVARRVLRKARSLVRRLA